MCVRKKCYIYAYNQLVHYTYEKLLEIGENLGLPKIYYNMYIN